MPPAAPAPAPAAPAPAAPKGIEALKNSEVTAAIDQALNATSFRDRNQHLTATEISALKRHPRTWPAKPVFHGYAFTHEAYGQGTVVAGAPCQCL